MRKFLLCSCMALLLLFSNANTADSGTTLAKASQMLASEQAEQALELLQATLMDDPMNIELCLLAGQAAMKTGEYDLAVMLFDRVLILDETHSEAQLALGQAYEKLEARDLAKEQYRQIIETSKDAAARRQAIKRLSLLETRLDKHKLAGMMRVGIMWDSNVHGTPNETTFDTTSGVRRVGTGNREKRTDWLATEQAFLLHEYRWDKGPWYWTSSAFLSADSYFEEENVDISYVSLQTGPAYKKGKWAGQVQGTFSYMHSDYDRYRKTTGLQAKGQYAIHPRLRLESQLRWETRKYYTAREDDADVWELYIGPRMIFGKQSLQLLTGVFFSDATEPDQAYDQAYLAMRYRCPLPWQLGFSAKYRLAYSAYDGNLPAFGEKRHDLQSQYALGLTKPIGKGVSANLEYRYTDTNSNIELYDSHRQRALFALTWSF